MKPKPEYVEGTEAAKRFGAAIQKLLTVSSSEIKRREAEYRKTVDANPNRRGPKRKVKPSA